MSHLKTTLAATAFALAAGAASAQAPAADLSAFDASRASTPAEKLVLCDTTAFLRTRPDLNSQRMFARRDGQPFQLLIGPYFVQGGVLYSQRYDRLLQRLQHAGQLNHGQVAEVQATLGRRMIQAYGHGNWLPNRWAGQQQTYCTAFARQNGVNEPE
jgi:hypothetical protein